MYLHFSLSRRFVCDLLIVFLQRFNNRFADCVRSVVIAVWPDLYPAYDHVVVLNLINPSVIRFAHDISP